MVVLETSLKVSMNARILGCSEGETRKMTMVLAHGFGGDQSVWDKMIPYLSQRFQVMVFDWNFTGDDFDAVKYSSLDAFAKDLICLLDEMNLSSCVFVGHSMSGMIGCLASIRRPDLFQRLILLSASPRYLNSEEYEGGFEMPQIEEIFTNMELNFQAWATFFASLVVDASDPPSVEIFHKSLCRMRPEIALSLAKTIFCGDLRSILEKVQAPCTIIQTSNDIVVPNSVAYYMQKKINAKSTVEMIEGDGHFPQLTRVKQLLEVLDRIMSLDSEIKVVDKVMSLDSEIKVDKDLDSKVEVVDRVMNLDSENVVVDKVIGLETEMQIST